MRKVASIFLSTFFVTLGGIAADYYVLGAVGSGTEYLFITEHGVCNAVSNGTGNTIFVPTRAAAEWQAFRSAPPPGVTVSTCCAKAC